MKTKTESAEKGKLYVCALCGNEQDGADGWAQSVINGNAKWEQACNNYERVKSRVEDLRAKLDVSVEAHRNTLDDAKTILRERDELLAACRAVVFTWEHNFKGQQTGYEGTPLEADYQHCKQAIANVTEIARLSRATSQASFTSRNNMEASVLRQSFKT